MKQLILMTACLLVLIVSSQPASGQNAATGAIRGTVSDPSGAGIPGAKVVVTNPGTGAVITYTADSDGNYRISLLPPGTYRVEFSATGFGAQVYPNIIVNVTEIATVNATLQVGEQKDTVTVEAEAQLVQAEAQALGGVVGEKEVKSLPLTNRNYTQILSLSPGVAGEVTNAAQLGRNTQDVYVNGGRAIDNNFQMDGIEVNNFGTGRAGDWLGYTGIPIPNPDSILEFKVQTGLFDAGYGQGVGANVQVVTKSGTNQLHGSVFEFFRNEVLNANDFFLNSTGSPRPVFKQNQFGFTLGGRLIKDKFFWFGSYQGTRQVSGEGSNSLQSSFLPPITNDRSASTLGMEFCGQSGAFGGVPVACNGSNISPVAVNLLNYKLPSGQYMIPTPQKILPSGVGFSVFSIPSRFTEDQFIGNVDYVINARNSLSGRFFSSRDPELLSFTYANTPGSGAKNNFQNRDFSLKLASTIHPTLVNELHFGFTRNFGTLNTVTPNITKEMGMTPANPDVNTLPVIGVNGLFSLGGGWNDGFVTATNTFIISDQISWTHGPHTVRAGIEWQKIQYNFDLPGGHRGSISIQSFPDFLLGMSAAQNGSAYSNLFSAGGLEGITDRQFRLRNWASFVQEDYKVNRRLTVNLGVRWEVFGGLSEKRGYLSDFWPQLAKNDFPAGGGGTFSGFMVASNYKGVLPNGVFVSNNNTCCLNATPLGNIGPRVGLAWKPFARSDRVVVRAGFGMFYSRTSGNMLLQLVTMYPFVSANFYSGPQNGLSTFQVPFNPAPPLPSDFPIWVPRTPTSAFSFEWLLPDWKAPRTESWSLNTQVEVAKNWLLLIGYVGTRGERLVGFRSPNQAYLASPSNPVNGITTNTVANAGDRVSIRGVSPGTSGPETFGYSWYNALQTSLTKRFSHGFSLQGSYSWDRTFDNFSSTTGINSVWGGFQSGDVRKRRASWGPSDFDRPHRFVFNYVWDLPSPKTEHAYVGKIAKGWQLSGVATMQTGHRLSFYDSNSGSIYGVFNNFAQFCPGMKRGNIATNGSMSQRLNNYFNAGAFCSPPAIGDGFDFGNVGRGLVGGPGQNNYDISLSKRTSVWGPKEGANVEFRAEFFNAFNHPQFVDPGLNVSFSNFGQIGATSVAPRLIQFALKYNF